jgi:hypothetical protein
MKKTFPNYYSTHQREDPARDLVFEEQIWTVWYHG